MSTATVYPNGQILESSALTAAQVQGILQQLTLGMIGAVGILTAIPHAGDAGSAYVTGDIVTVVQAGALAGQLIVTAVAGVVTALAPVAPNDGMGYQLGTNLATTGGAGTGLTVDITSVGPSPTTDLVRIEWPIKGQPFGNANQDVCYIGAIDSSDDEYAKVRDEWITQNYDPNETITLNYSYTRTWRILWSLYGPNAFDHARAIKSALFLDYYTDALSLDQLFPVSDFPQPRRLPELINSQWFERVDYDIEIYEFVKETIVVNSVLSAEVIVENSEGQIADVTIT